MVFLMAAGLLGVSAAARKKAKAKFIDTITGSVTANNQGGVFVDFDNTVQHFTFGNDGSFNFFVNDVSLNAGKTIAFSGTILVIEPRQTGVIPEPGTYALLLAGLAAVGFMARRRKPDGPATRKKASQARLFSWRGATGPATRPVHNRDMHDAASVAARRRPASPGGAGCSVSVPGAGGSAAPKPNRRRRHSRRSCSTRRCPPPARGRPIPRGMPTTCGHPARRLGEDHSEPRRHGLVPGGLPLRRSDAARRAARALRRARLHQPAGAPQRPPDLQRRPHGRADDPQLRPAAADHPAAGAAQSARQRSRPARRRPSGRERRLDPPRRRPLGACSSGCSRRSPRPTPRARSGSRRGSAAPAWFWSASAASCSRSAGCTGARSISRTSAGSASAGRSCRSATWTPDLPWDNGVTEFML